MTAVLRMPEAKRPVKRSLQELEEVMLNQSRMMVMKVLRSNVF